MKTGLIFPAVLIWAVQSGTPCAANEPSFKAACVRQQLMSLLGSQAFAQMGQVIEFVVLDPVLGGPQGDPVTVAFKRIEGGVLIHSEGVVPLHLIKPGSIKLSQKVVPQRIAHVETATPPPTAPQPSKDRSPGIPLIERGRLKAIVESPSGITVSANEADLAEGEVSQIPNAVRIRRPGETYPLNYNRTNRGLATLSRSFYSPRAIHPAKLRGQTVVDMGTGGGKAVEEWRAAGIAAFGLDSALSARQKENIFTYPVTETASHSEVHGIDLKAPKCSGFYIQADVAHTGLASNQVDVIFSTYAIFEYDLFRQTSRQFLVDTLQEWHRILKLGGKIRMSPFYKISAEPILKALVSQVRGLRIDGFHPVTSAVRDGTYFVELVKTQP